MTLTRISLSNPVAVAVGCILIAIFGLISLSRLPIQMTPDLERPIIEVSTPWRASAPKEIESEILEPQEDVLRSIPGMLRMSAVASYGSGYIGLEFAVGTDLDRALIEVLNALNQVPRYPVDANEPIIRVGGNRWDNIIAWFSIRTVEGNTRPIESYQDFVEDEIVARFDRITGISQTGSFGGRKHEVRITFDPYKAANIGLDLTEIADELGTNSDVSAGINEVGKRQYTLRFSGKYDVENLGELVLAWRQGRPVLLRDVAKVELVMQDVTSVLHQSGRPSLALNISPEPGVNVLEVMAAVKATMADLQANELKRAGLEMMQSYDETVYINSSISMVRNNLLLGVTLAIIVLWWFLRRFRATLIVAFSIPLCLLTAFMVLNATGRTLNIISLAGLAFAVGMVLDAAIVVLENIFRQREQGLRLRGDEASLKGTTQVWGALLASTATTVAIFMPVIFLEDEVGQLFGDLAITISAGVVASLLVAVTVLPTAASNWIKREGIEDLHRGWWRWVTDHVMNWTDTPRKRWSWVAGLTVLPVALALMLLPPADYLPEGKKNLAFGFVLTPPGMGMKTIEEEFLNEIDRRMAPYLSGEKPQ
jgi:multidrug efflux pump subunit AcrB